MKIAGAVMRLEQDYKVKRHGWKDAFLWLTTVKLKFLGGEMENINDEDGQKVTERKVILIKTPTGQGPWTPQPEDLTAEDWEEAALVENVPVSIEPGSPNT